MLQSGIGVGRNPKRAAPWLVAAANQGDVEAMFILGKMYVQGDGVPENIARGVALIINSAIGGYVPAMSMAADAYDRGFGVNRNPNEAIRFSRMAASYGDPEALAFLRSKGL
jgi:TPR repeat protein